MLEEKQPEQSPKEPLSAEEKCLELIREGVKQDVKGALFRAVHSPTPDVFEALLESTYLGRMHVKQGLWNGLHLTEYLWRYAKWPIEKKRALIGSLGVYRKDAKWSHEMYRALCLNNHSLKLEELPLQDSLGNTFWHYLAVDPEMIKGSEALHAEIPSDRHALNVAKETPLDVAIDHANVAAIKYLLLYRDGSPTDEELRACTTIAEAGSLEMQAFIQLFVTSAQCDPLIYALFDRETTPFHRLYEHLHQQDKAYCHHKTAPLYNALKAEVESLPFQAQLDYFVLTCPGLLTSCSLDVKKQLLREMDVRIGETHPLRWASHMAQSRNVLPGNDALLVCHKIFAEEEQYFNLEDGLFLLGATEKRAFGWEGEAEDAELAALRKQVPFLKMCIEDHITEAFCSAIRYEYTAVVTQLWRYFCNNLDIISQQKTNGPLLKWTIHHYSKQESGQQSPERCQAQAGIIKLLLTNQKNVEINKVLTLAIQLDSPNLVRIILQHVPHIVIEPSDENGHTLLFLAAAKAQKSGQVDDLAIVQLLLEKGANISAENKEGKTPFTEYPAVFERLGGPAQLMVDRYLREEKQEEDEGDGTQLVQQLREFLEKYKQDALFEAAFLPTPKIFECLLHHPNPKWMHVELRMVMTFYYLPKYVWQATWPLEKKQVLLRALEQLRKDIQWHHPIFRMICLNDSTNLEAELQTLQLKGPIPRDSFGNTAWHYAARNPATMEIVKNLPLKMANEKNTGGETPAEVAIAHNNFDMMQYLFLYRDGSPTDQELDAFRANSALKDNPRAQDFLQLFVISAQCHPLIYAILIGNYVLFQELYSHMYRQKDKRCDSYKSLYDGLSSCEDRRALPFLLDNFVLTCSELLAFCPFDVKKQVFEKMNRHIDQEALFQIDSSSSKGLLLCHQIFAKTQGYANLAIRLSQLDIGIKAHGYDALCLAIQYKYVDIVAYLLERRREFLSPEQTNHALLWAVDCYTMPRLSNLHPEALFWGENILELLLKNKADANTPPALIMAVRLGNLAVTTLLLAYGANIRTTGILSAAIQSGNLDMVRMLLEKGADIEQVDEWGDLPLFCAAARGDGASVQCLLENGANPDAKNNEGKTLITEYPAVFKSIGDPMELTFHYHLIQARQKLKSEQTLSDSDAKKEAAPSVCSIAMLIGSLRRWSNSASFFDNVMRGKEVAQITNLINQYNYQDNPLEEAALVIAAQQVFPSIQAAAQTAIQVANASSKIDPDDGQNTRLTASIGNLDL